MHENFPSSSESYTGFTPRNMDTAVQRVSGHSIKYLWPNIFPISFTHPPDFDILVWVTSTPLREKYPPGRTIQALLVDERCSSDFAPKTHTLQQFNCLCTYLYYCYGYHSRGQYCCTPPCTAVCRSVSYLISGDAARYIIRLGGYNLHSRATHEGGWGTSMYLYCSDTLPRTDCRHPPRWSEG